MFLFGFVWTRGDEDRELERDELGWEDKADWMGAGTATERVG